MSNAENIPLNNLTAQHREIEADLIRVFKDVLAKNNYIMGDQVAAFEQEFAAFCKSKIAVGVANGTDAIYIGLKALGVKPGDHVVTVANTFIATAEAIGLLGARPVFVDVDEDTLLMSPGALEEALTKLKRAGTPAKAIIPVHLYGQCCDMPKIMELARRYDARVLEDSAQAHGAEWNGTRVGNFGDLATYSFYPGKNLGALGDAGALTTNDATLGAYVRKFRDHGRTSKYSHDIEGVNSRLDTLQAGFLRVKLGKLEKWTDQRIAVAKHYRKCLSNIDVRCLPARENARDVYHLFVIRLTNRDELKTYLEQNGISCGIHYPTPLHLQPAYAHLGYQKGALPIAEKSSKEILSLPTDSYLTNPQIEMITGKIRDFLAAGR